MLTDKITAANVTKTPTIAKAMIESSGTDAVAVGAVLDEGVEDEEEVRVGDEEGELDAV
jgi:hypothetical protein